MSQRLCSDMITQRVSRHAKINTSDLRANSIGSRDVYSSCGIEGYIWVCIPPTVRQGLGVRDLALTAVSVNYDWMVVIGF